MITIEAKVRQSWDMKNKFAIILFWLLLLIPLWVFIGMLLFELSNGMIDIMNYKVILACFLIMPISAVYFILQKNVYSKIYGWSICLYIIYQLYVLLTDINGAL